MFSKHVTRLLFFSRYNILKCDTHNLSRISDLNAEKSLGKHVKVQGWVRVLRKMKNAIFVDVTDGSTGQMLQIVIPKNFKPDQLTCGSSISAEGELALAPNGRLELRASNACVFGSGNVSEGYPFIEKRKHPPEYLREYLHLRPRTKSFSSLLRLRDLASTAVNNHLRNRGFINVHTPIITSNDCEGAGEVFSVKADSKEVLESMKRDNVPLDQSYFDKKAFLTVSGQLHLEVMVRALSKVYTFGPTFRAENSKSRLHLSEFYMVEAEQAFIYRVEDIAKEVELLVKGITKEIIDKGSEDFHSINASEPLWLNEKFGYITYDEAVQILHDHKDRLGIPINHGDSFSKEHELFLVEHNNNIPLFVVNWPKDGKPFYMKECVEDPSKVAGLDLLTPNVGELVGGSIREDDYDKLKSKLPNMIDLSWYLDIRKYGNVATGGFGMGFERYLQFILGVHNIKDVIPFPRWPHNCFM